MPPFFSERTNLLGGLNPIAGGGGTVGVKLAVGEAEGGRHRGGNSSDGSRDGDGGAAPNERAAHA